MIFFFLYIYIYIYIYIYKLKKKKKKKTKTKQNKTKETNKQSAQNPLKQLDHFLECIIIGRNSLDPKTLARDFESSISWNLETTRLTLWIYLHCHPKLGHDLEARHSEVKLTQNLYFILY